MSEVSSFPPNSALHVLSTPELLDPIFKFLDDASNARNATVCRQWSEIALDLLWHDVRDMYRLLSIFAPLKAADDGSFYFERKLQFNDWETSERYRSRVKHLSYHSSKPKLIHPSALEELARSRIRMKIMLIKSINSFQDGAQGGCNLQSCLFILPNMRMLDWDGPPDLYIIFMHLNVESLSITLPTRKLYVGALLEDIGARMQNLTQLNLRPKFAISTIESDVITLLSGLTNLRELALPLYCFTSGIASAASHIRKLESIKTSDSTYFGAWQDVVQFNPLLQDDAYQSLNKLRICVSFLNAATFVGKLAAPTNLTVLCISPYPNSETPDGFMHLATAISNNLQCLISLELSSPINSGKLKDKIYREEDHVTFKHLRPLLKCSRLTSFKIKHHYPLRLELADVEEIAMAWPGLKSIHLNPEPFFMDRSSLTLDALLPFAHHCPELRTIGLFLEATQSTNCHPTYPRFRVLNKLSIGASIINQDELSVTSFLGLILPTGCNVDNFGVTWNTSGCTKQILDTLQFRRDKWLVVKKWLPVLLDYRRRGMEEERSQRTERISHHP